MEATTTPSFKWSKAPKAIIDTLMSVRQDGWKNVLTGLSVQGKDARIAARHCRRNKAIDHQEIESLYETDDLFPLVIDRLPQHATRRWLRVTAQDDGGALDTDFGLGVHEALKKVSAQAKVYDLYRLHRLYGGSAMIIGADDGRKAYQPLDLANVREVKFLNVLTRHQIHPGPRELNPLDEHYDQPAYYTAMGTTDQIHHSRVLRIPKHLISSELSPFAADGWDLPLVERVYEPIRQFGTLFGYAETSFQDLSQGVMTMKGLAAMLAADDGTEDVMNRLRVMALVRSTLNMIVLDTDETYERRNANPVGLSDVMLRVMDRVCAAAETPLSILFGQAPTGLSTDDTGGRTTFYDTVSNNQERLLDPVVTPLIEVLIAAKKGPLKGKKPSKWSHAWNPLQEESEKDQADTDLVRATAEEKRAQLGVYSPDEIRTRYLNDPDCPYQLDTSRDLAQEELDAQRNAAKEAALAQSMSLRGKQAATTAPKAP